MRIWSTQRRSRRSSPRSGTKRWFVYAKRPFAGPKAVLAYLSRYTHRVAISNRRLIALDERRVTFKVKDYRIDGPGRYTTMTLDVDEFIRRFLDPRPAQGLPPHPPLRPARRQQPRRNDRGGAQTLGHGRALRPRPAVETDPAAPPLAVPCPCCGGRMFIIETFGAGRRPRHRPAAPLAAIRIDTS